jgi:uncharacterized protein YjbJ (UPF0337 family)
MWVRIVEETWEIRDSRLLNLFQTGAAMPRESTKDEVKGKAHEIKGKIKQKAGRALNRPDIEEQGQDEEIAGKVQKKVGQIKKVFGS